MDSNPPSSNLGYENAAMNDVTFHYFVSDSVRSVDFQWTLAELNKLYFGKDRTMEQLVEQCRNSCVFALMRRDYAAEGFDSQVGFCRVVTDRVSFGWLSDFFLSEEHRGKGLGHFMLHEVLRNHEIKKLTMNLVTRDQHDFYSKFSFMRDSHMIRRPE